tara:strand:+ start:772 stop:945 length:174 start_codon:yes stop_codon:yes gene_type:complete
MSNNQKLFDKGLEITYLEGQVIGILKSIAELKNHEIALMTKRNEIEDKIEELKKEVR